jgi:anti-sigma regulatory factor (Ser/Thr protein kinase)
MPPSLVLTAPATPLRGPVRATLEGRLAAYADRLEPPVVEVVGAPDGAALVEALYWRAADLARVPALALHEVLENLAHAEFEDALVSVLDGGRTVRVSDRGPGIADPERALEPGFTSADADARRVVRGAGSGLPLAGALMADCGGRLELAANLGGGAVVTLAMPASRAPAAHEAAAVGETGRRLLALLVELAPATPARLADELDLCPAECGRELALLEHRGLVERAPGGARALAERGASLVATLF